MSITEIIIRVLWFLSALNRYFKANFALTAIIWIIGVILGVLAGVFGSPLFNGITFWGGGLIGFLIYGIDDPLPASSTILLSGYIIGQIARALFKIF